MLGRSPNGASAPQDPDDIPTPAFRGLRLLLLRLRRRRLRGGDALARLHKDALLRAAELRLKGADRSEAALAEKEIHQRFRAHARELGERALKACSDARARGVAAGKELARLKRDGPRPPVEPDPPRERVVTLGDALMLLAFLLIDTIGAYLGTLFIPIAEVSSAAEPFLRWLFAAAIAAVIILQGGSWGRRMAQAAKGTSKYRWLLAEAALIWAVIVALAVFRAVELDRLSGTSLLAACSFSFVLAGLALASWRVSAAIGERRAAVPAGRPRWPVRRPSPPVDVVADHAAQVRAAANAVIEADGRVGSIPAETAEALRGVRERAAAAINAFRGELGLDSEPVSADALDGFEPPEELR